MNTCSLPARARAVDLSARHAKFIQREEKHRFIRISAVVLHSGALSQASGCSVLGLCLWTCIEMISHSPELFFQSFSNETYRGNMLCPNSQHFFDELKWLQGLGLYLQQPLPVSVLHGDENREERSGEKTSIFPAGKSCPMYLWLVWGLGLARQGATLRKSQRAEGVICKAKTRHFSLDLPG